MFFYKSLSPNISIVDLGSENFMMIKVFGKKNEEVMKEVMEAGKLGYKLLNRKAYIESRRLLFENLLNVISRGVYRLTKKGYEEARASLIFATCSPLAWWVRRVGEYPVYFIRNYTMKGALPFPHKPPSVYLGDTKLVPSESFKEESLEGDWMCVSTKDVVLTINEKRLGRFLIKGIKSTQTPKEIGTAILEECVKRRKQGEYALILIKR